MSAGVVLTPERERALKATLSKVLRDCRWTYEHYIALLNKRDRLYQAKGGGSSIPSLVQGRPLTQTSFTELL